MTTAPIPYPSLENLTAVAAWIGFITCVVILIGAGIWVTAKTFTWMYGGE